MLAWLCCVGSHITGDELLRLLKNILSWTNDMLNKYLLHWTKASNGSSKSYFSLSLYILEILSDFQRTLLLPLNCIFLLKKKIIVNAILKILTKGRQSDRVWGMKGKSVPWDAMKNSEPWSWTYKLWCIWPRLPPSTPREVMWPTSWWVQGHLGHTCKYLWRFCHLFVEKNP